MAVRFILIYYIDYFLHRRDSAWNRLSRPELSGIFKYEWMCVYGLILLFVKPATELLRENDVYARGLDIVVFPLALGPEIIIFFARLQSLSIYIFVCVGVILTDYI
jgi:hypothetical protein